MPQAFCAIYSAYFNSVEEHKSCPSKKIWGVLDLVLVVGEVSMVLWKFSCLCRFSADSWSRREKQGRVYVFKGSNSIYSLQGLYILPPVSKHLYPLSQIIMKLFLDHNAAYVPPTLKYCNTSK
jgi:hypothetical protein